MSSKFDAFDLNADVNLVELNPPENLMEPSSDPGVVVGFNSINGGVDEIRVPADVSNQNEGSETVDHVSKMNGNGVDLGLSVGCSTLGADEEMAEEEEEKVSELGVSRKPGGGSNGIDLVVDLTPGSMSCGNGFGYDKVDSNNKAKDAGKLRKGSRIEKEGKYQVSDLVWGKVKSHPWWPGQIFDASASSERAKKYFKKDSFLIAYFGDQTFAWNEALKIKPFRMHFDRMNKQINSESFVHAVDCALDEVSRRVEFGLACSCLSEEVYRELKSQVIENAGIREESRIIVGGDDFSGISSFIPAKVVQYVKELARDPVAGTSRLQFCTLKAQLSAFSRWKGDNQLSAFELLDGVIENDDNITLLGEDAVLDSGNEQVLNVKGKTITQDSSSRKRKHISIGGLRPSKKEKRLSEVLSSDCSSVPDGQKISGKGKVDNSVSSDSKAESETTGKTSSTPKKRLRVGDGICRVANRLSESTSNLKNGDGSSQQATNGSSPLTSSSKKTGMLNVPAEELLSQLCLIATNPMEEHSSLIPVVKFFSDFRTNCLENSGLREHKVVATEKEDAKETDKPLSETLEPSQLEGLEDSYWTDRIIQSNPDEHVLFEPVVEQDNMQETAVVNRELDKKCKENSGTALILKFNNKDSLPSEANLNKIFNRYGPLKESETEVLKKSNRAKVVFKRRPDAETAFSSAGKFSIFGPALVSYRLDYSPTPRKASTSGSRKAVKKASTSVKAMS